MKTPDSFAAPRGRGSATPKDVFVARPSNKVKPPRNKDEFNRRTAGAIDSNIRNMQKFYEGLNPGKDVFVERPKNFPNRNSPVGVELQKIQALRMAASRAAAKMKGSKNG